MKIDPTQLLKQLASSGLLGGVGGAGAALTTAPGQGAFADLLAQARDGTLSTKLPVTLHPGANVQLSDDQLARLSVAADRAEAAGLRNALVLMDGQQLVMDVHSRQVMGTAQSQHGIVGGVDGVIDLGNSGASAVSALAPNAQSTAALSPPKASPLQNASLARLLQTLGQN